MSFSSDLQCVINTTSTFSGNSSTLNKLSPITETIPIPLIPVCNRPLVFYQLDLVVKSNFASVVLIVEEKYEKLVKQKVEEYIKDNKLIGVLEVEYVVLIERSRDGDGDVEVLRELGKRKNAKKETLLKKDFFLIGCDVIAGHILYDLADAYRKYDASVALAYSGPTMSNGNINNKTNKQKISDKTKKKPQKTSEYVGLARKSISCTKDVICARVVYSKLKGSFKDNEKLALPKALLAKCPDISIRSDLHCLNVYLFKQFILDLVRKKEEFRSIKDDLIPFLVNRDGRTFEDPTLKITSPVRRQISNDTTVPEEENNWEENERFKVFSVIFPAKMNVFCGRAGSIKSYLSLSMDLMGDEAKSTKSESSDLVDKTERPWPIIQKGFNRFFQSKEDAPEKKLWRKLRGFIAAELPNERPKGTNCVIGKSVVLGKNVKLSNAILMDGVRIEDDCTIQDTILCTKVRVRKGCNIKDSQIGADFEVPEKSKIVSEVRSCKAFGLPGDLPASPVLSGLN